MDLTDYRVSTDLFEGPLDLLLYLVRKYEIDVRQVAMSRVVDEFNSYLQVLSFLDLGFIGEFLVTATSLMEIKSREALPVEEVEEDEELLTDEPAGDLVQRLLAYQRFKDAAVQLKTQAESWRSRYPRLSDDRPRSDRDPARDFIKGVELWDLVSALARILETKEVVAYGTVELDKTPMSVFRDHQCRKARSRP